MIFRAGLIAIFIAVTAVSSWLTLQALNYLEPPRASTIRIDAGGAITIVEATYGMSCVDFAVAPPRENRVRPGNATRSVAAACNRRGSLCMYGVDVAQLSDPADGCAKDFQVTWRCGAEGSLREAKLPAEANGKTVGIACPR
jgi:hypothetical protein